MASITRPASDEYAPFYAGYIQAVPEGDIFDILARQIDSLRGDLAGVSDRQASVGFAPGEWSIKEIVGHINDAERVFAYRVLRISRGDATPLPSFDQDVYVQESDFNARPLADLVQEFEWLRRANLIAFTPLSGAVGLRRGTASTAPVSVRALIYMLAGHVIHHMESIRANYLK